MEVKEANLRQILAANLKAQRKLLGISQEKLAEITGFSWQTVNSIECQRTWAKRYHP
jgi:DNA-binding XRE family transcriptional regulator